MTPRPLVPVHFPPPAWLCLAGLGWLLWWPLGLALTAYLFWRMSMSCCGFSIWRRDRQDSDTRLPGSRTRWSGATGNQVFDEYREETLRRLEEEQRAFQAYLARLRAAKDRAEFDQFMAERRADPDAGQPA